jgi:protease-4
MLNEIHQQFITVVRTGRGARLKETPEMFSGLYWTGAKAVEMGLADGFGTVDTVARDIVKAEDIVDYTAHEGLPERVLKKFGASVGEGALKAMSRTTLPKLN